MNKTSNFILRTMFNKKDGEYKLSGFWYSIFRPINNRYYVGIKLYSLSFIIRYVPLSLFVIYFALTDKYTTIWLLILVILILAALFDFFVIRKYEESVTWKYLYSNHYENNTNSEDARVYSMMNSIEKMPSTENIENLEQELKKSIKP